MSPQRAKRPCAKIGCPGLAEGGERYCPECKAKGINDHNEYKKQRTDKYEQSVYKTARWKVIRGIRLRLNPLCQDCEKLGRVTAAQMVDHIKPIKQGGDPYDLDNTQSLCNGCHNKKTANE